MNWNPGMLTASKECRPAGAQSFFPRTQPYGFAFARFGLGKPLNGPPALIKVATTTFSPEKHSVPYGRSMAEHDQGSKSWA